MRENMLFNRFKFDIFLQSYWYPFWLPDLVTVHKSGYRLVTRDKGKYVMYFYHYQQYIEIWKQSRISKPFKKKDCNNAHLILYLLLDVAGLEV